MQAPVRPAYLSGFGVEGDWVPDAAIQTRSGEAGRAERGGASASSAPGAPVVGGGGLARRPMHVLPEQRHLVTSNREHVAQGCVPAARQVAWRQPETALLFTGQQVHVWHPSVQLEASPHPAARR